MNILYISTWFPYPPDNGSKQRAYHLIKSLSGKHQVSVVAFHPQDGHRVQPHRWRIDSVRVKSVPEDPFRWVNLPTALKYLSPIPVMTYQNKDMVRAVSLAAAAHQWDAVVAFQLPAARYALIPAAAARIFDVDNSLSFMTQERINQAAAALARLRAQISFLKTSRYESHLARKFDACTVVSPIEVPFLEAMVKNSGCHVSVNANGVDCDYNRPGLAARRPNTLVYNGSLTYHANYDAMRWFLADIFPLIRENNPEVRLSITGSTRDVPLDQLSLNESVKLTGYIEDIRTAVAEAAVCVVPIRQGSGTRLKILEAMALGTPVVTTTKGAEGLEVEHGRHLLIADDARGFAEAVAKLLRDHGLGQSLREQSRKLVEKKYDWGLVGQEFVSLVENTVEAAKGRNR